MESILFWIIMYISEILKLSIVLLYLLEYKPTEKYWSIMLGSVPVFGSITIITFIFNLNEYYLTYLLGSFATLLVIICIRGKKKIIIGILSFLLICLVDMALTGLVAIFINYTIEMILDNIYVSILCNTLSILVLMVIKMVKKLLKMNQMILSYYILPGRYIIMAFLGVLGVGLYIAPVHILGLLKLDDRMRNIIVFGISLSGLTFLAFLGLLIIINNSKVYYKELSDLNTKLIIQQKNYYKALIEKEVETRKFRHDIKNHMYCLTHLSEQKEYDKLNAYLKEINMVSEKLIINIYTGNDIVNTILNHIINDSCKDEKNIEIKWFGLIPEKIKLSSMELCILFSNLFSNAVEASNKIDNEDIKVITVKVRNLDSNLLIIITNPIKEKVNIINNKLMTSKKDVTRHGFGTLNIENIVEKYNGSIKYFSTHNEFSVEIILDGIVL
ncbi:GHKL domain-containing protein [Natranaerovirga pectinivora]|uniref:GHKL domain-containing protein n=1 Tax=Natranaerovirga pectinivora TaxID=682400 RepID=A0A4R3MJR0_9FIRM|nr:sensor histidine kinase [Natranaerovirga pectinivora]TCT14360.1 GHKL domain-containing protein [Natranaerovirga pectinivora]